MGERPTRSFGDALRSPSPLPCTVFQETVHNQESAEVCRRVLSPHVPCSYAVSYTHLTLPTILLV
eukprot:3212070-Pleurochrysis_carterae.AAC.1